MLAYAYVYASQYFVQAKWQMPEVPSGLATLLGLSVGTTALAIGATEVRGSKGAGPAHPGIGDLITNGGVFASDRLQFFLWTILGVVAFVHTTLSHDPATLTEPPKIPDSFLPLMGVSSLGYLAGKVLRKPGPVIKQVEKSPPDGLRILGENLSPRAQVFVGSQLMASRQGPARHAGGGERVRDRAGGDRSSARRGAPDTGDDDPGPAGGDGTKHRPGAGATRSAVAEGEGGQPGRAERRDLRLRGEAGKCQIPSIDRGASSRSTHNLGGARARVARPAWWARNRAPSPHVPALPKRGSLCPRGRGGASLLRSRVMFAASPAGRSLPRILISSTLR